MSCNEDPTIILDESQNITRIDDERKEMLEDFKNLELLIQSKEDDV